MYRLLQSQPMNGSNRDVEVRSSISTTRFVGLHLRGNACCGRFKSRSPYQFHSRNAEFVLRGGTQRATGLQSVIRASSIIAIKGKDFIVRHFDHEPTLTKEMLLARDRHLCAYCAQSFRFGELDMEHIVPISKGGATSWMNLVAACKACNNRKANRTPEAAGMKLHYVPYVPNRYEAFILSNRKILADQMEFLLLGVPKSSRMHISM